MRRRLIMLYLIFFLLRATAFAQYPGDARPDEQASAPDLRLTLDGALGRQIANVVDEWLIRAPRANPAMLEVFALRDRAPDSSEYYVPWVGEFVGKYLLSATLASQISDSDDLRTTLEAVEKAFADSQTEDGYLGPFPRDKRLKVGWDLWGHYHAIVAFEEIYRRFGTESALRAATRAADYICARYADGRERPKDAGSDEMNLAAVTALLRIYRLTGEERYLATARIFLKDLESCGDFYRAGLAGTEFYRTARPRWESLHTITGLAEMCRITGDDSYRIAFENLYESIRTRDIHANGSFSSGEQAVGAPCRLGAIETCCTVAWIALSVEASRLSGDSRVADELENSLFNAVAAYTHPSGSWCAYDAPLNGRREASFDTINFQARPGQPELNCCSVNGPRGFGELVDWAITFGRDSQGEDAICVNYYGPIRATFTFDARRFELTQETRYPLDGEIRLRLRALDGNYDKPIPMKLRVPSWSENATFVDPKVDKEPRDVAPGQYLEFVKEWRDGDEVVLTLPLKYRFTYGDDDYAGRFCVYYGPTLLAWDQSLNANEIDDLPALSEKNFESAKISFPDRDIQGELVGRYAPQVVVELANGIVLRDFAGAGASGESYAAFLPTRESKPAPPICVEPLRNARIPRGAIRFARRTSKEATPSQFVALVSDSVDFHNVTLEVPFEKSGETFAAPDVAARLRPNTTYYWKLVARNEFGTTESRDRSRSFVVDPDLEPIDWEARLKKRELDRTNRELVVDPLAGQSQPTIGETIAAKNIAPRPGVDGEENGAVAFNGRDSEITYRLDAFPEVAYEATLVFALDALPEKGHIAEVISAWTKGMDDPLRVAIDDEGKLYGAVENGKSYSTRRVPIEPGAWTRVRVVKDRGVWKLYCDEELVGEFNVDPDVSTESTIIGLGCNPKYRERSEFFTGRISNFRLSGVVSE